jgi:hypothetical protein
VPPPLVQTAAYYARLIPWPPQTIRSNFKKQAKGPTGEEVRDFVKEVAEIYEEMCEKADRPCRPVWSLDNARIHNYVEGDWQCKRCTVSRARGVGGAEEEEAEGERAARQGTRCCTLNFVPLIVC